MKFWSHLRHLGRAYLLYFFGFKALQCFSFVIWQWTLTWACWQVPQPPTNVSQKSLYISGYPTSQQPVYDLFMSSSFLFMTWSWLVHDLFMTCSILVHNFFMTFSWLFHDLFRLVRLFFITCSWLVNDLLNTCSHLLYDFFMAYSILVPYLFISSSFCSWLFHDLIIAILQLSKFNLLITSSQINLNYFTYTYLLHLLPLNYLT